MHKINFIFALMDKVLGDMANWPRKIGSDGRNMMAEDISNFSPLIFSDLQLNCLVVILQTYSPRRSAVPR